MAKGGYRGGSTILHTGNLKIGGGMFAKPKVKRKPQQAPGMHVLSKEDRKKIMKRVWASRRKVEAETRKKKAAEEKFKADAFAKFVADVKQQQQK